MVYLGPIEPRSLKVKKPTQVQAVSASASVHRVEEQEPVPQFGEPGFIERRKGDRRQQSKNPMLETRAGKDRRKNGAGSISISV